VRGFCAEAVLRQVIARAGRSLHTKILVLDERRERERHLYWINSGESQLASVAAGGLAMLLLPSRRWYWARCKGHQSRDEHCKDTRRIVLV
jgi:hypothetical protein